MSLVFKIIFHFPFSFFFKVTFLSFEIQGAHIGSVHGIVKSKKLSCPTPLLQIIYAPSTVKYFLSTYKDVIFPLPLHMLCFLLKLVWPFFLQLLYFSAKLSLNTLGWNKHLITFYFACTRKKISKIWVYQGHRVWYFHFHIPGLDTKYILNFFNEENRGQHFWCVSCTININ